jgi:hypothetical protein
LAAPFLIATLAAGGPRTLQAQPAHHPVNVSFFHPLSTNRDPAVSTNFRLNVLYGRVGAIRGFDLSGVAGRVDGPVRGLQVTGVVACTRGELRGAAVAGLLAYGGGDGTGMQASGLVNFDRGRFRGLQYAGLFNFVERDFEGAQVTGFYNLANADARWLQAASVVNAVAGSFAGVQVTGGFNYVQESIHGLQAGLAGFAGTCRGAQIGLANFATTVHGVQVGVVNVAERNEGYTVGAVNVAGNGGADWVSFATNLAAFNTGVRTALRGFYSMFTAGIGDLQDGRGDTGFLTWNYGYGLSMARRWTLDTDLGFAHIVPRTSDDAGKNTRLHYALQARALGELRWSPATALFFGGGLSAVLSEYSTDATVEFEPLAVVGVSLF